jgi:hypothetical protein
MDRSLFKKILALPIAIATLSATVAIAALPVINDIGTPRFTRQGGVVPYVTSRTVPYFSFAQTDPTNNTTYNLLMVGADPRAGTTTTVPTEIIPIKFNFANGATLDGSDRNSALTISPIFQNSTFSAAMAAGDIGQYGDVYMRAQFNQIGSSYHVKLGQPTIFSTVVINVPKNHGFGAIVGQTGPLVGLIDYVWFSAQLQNLLSQLQIDAATLPIFLTDNIFLYFGNDPATCCVLGYHGAGHPTGLGFGSVHSNGNAPVQTFVWGSYMTPGIFLDAPAIADIQGLTHEVAEWLDDPFTINVVQPWLTPTAPQYGCSVLLEVGDPVVGIGFALPGNPDGGNWNPEDAVFWPWFLRESPSSAFGGHYTFMGPGNPFPGFQMPATGCS